MSGGQGAGGGGANVMALASGGGGPRIVTHDEDAAVDYPQPYLILDLRSPAEFGECHVLQARSFPQRLLMQDKSTLEMQQFKNKDGRRSFSPCALALAARSRSHPALSLSPRALTLTAHSHRASLHAHARRALTPRALALAACSRRALSPHALVACSLVVCAARDPAGLSLRDRRRAIVVARVIVAARDRRRARSSPREYLGADRRGNMYIGIVRVR